MKVANNVFGIGKSVISGRPLRLLFFILLLQLLFVTSSYAYDPFPGTNIDLQLDTPQTFNLSPDNPYTIKGYFSWDDTTRQYMGSFLILYVRVSFDDPNFDTSGITVNRGYFPMGISARGPGYIVYSMWAFNPVNPPPPVDPANPAFTVIIPAQPAKTVSISQQALYYNGALTGMGGHGWGTIPVTFKYQIALVATAISSSQIDLTWLDNSENEQGFIIERHHEVKTETTWVDTEYEQVATVGPNTTSYSDYNLLDGSRYWYRIRAYNEAGYSDYSNEADATTYPVAPVNLAATVISHKQVNLSWVNVSTNYNVGVGLERSTDGVNYESLGGASVPLNTFEDNYLNAGTTYYYRARAYNRTGPSEYYSSVVFVTTLPLTISDAISHVNHLYQNHLITDEKVYDFLIKGLNNAQDFLNHENPNAAVGKLGSVRNKIGSEIGKNIDQQSGEKLHEYVGDLIYSTMSATKTPQEIGNKKIDDSAKDANRRIDHDETLTDSEKAALKQKIDEITRTGKATIEVYATITPCETLTRTMKAIVEWTQDRMLQAVNGTDSCPEGYSCGVTIDWQTPVADPTTGTIEIPQSRWGSPVPEGPQIRINAKGPEGSSIAADLSSPSSSFPAKYINPESLTTTPPAVYDGDRSDSTIRGRVIADFTSGSVCDITYIKIEIRDTKTGGIICGQKLMIHLAE